MQATFSSAFLRGDEEAARFLNCNFRDPLFRQHLAQQMSARPRPCASELLQALHEQLQDLQLPQSAARSVHLEALGQPGTLAVVTGQQIGLFLGPLYTFYKAASAVAVANAIARETGIRCVPIFWLQTEDHDYDEINHCHVLVPDAAPLRLQLDSDFADGRGPATRVSVGHRRLGLEVTALLDAVEQSLQTLPHADEFLRLLRKRYVPGETLAAAFAGVLAELFAEEGLLVLNPRCAAVATLAVPSYRQVLLEHDAIAAALMTRALDLRAAGYSEQVPVRKDTALLFFHDGANVATGPRYRLQRYADGWAIPGRILSQDELDRDLKKEPLRFSTSALLRPLVQDSLLPTVAYVGGPGEINYLAQLAPLYGLFAQTQPMAVPRARFRCLDDQSLKLLRKLDLLAKDVETPKAELLRKLAARGSSIYQDLEALRPRLMAEVTQRLEEFATADATLQASVRKTANSIAHNLDKFAARCQRTLLERDQVTKQRVERLQSFLFPQDTPQERYYALPYFACKYGMHALKQKVLAPLRTGELFSTLAQGPKDLCL